MSKPQCQITGDAYSSSSRTKIHVLWLPYERQKSPRKKEHFSNRYGCAQSSQQAYRQLLIAITVNEFVS